MGVTFEVEDPATGERFLLNAYRRKGRLLLRRLPKHLQLKYATPRRLENLAEFSDAARTAFGQTGLVDGLPPAAAAVREILGSRGPRRPLPESAREPHQRELLRLVPEGLVLEVERLTKVPARFRLAGTLTGNEEHQ